MMISTSQGLLMGAKVDLIRPDRVVAEWTHRSLTPNNKFLYIAAKYVEADQANENRHFWSFESLQKAQATIVNSPINVMHQPHNIVGVMVDQEMMYPEAYTPEVQEKAAAYEYAKPYIEVLGALWKFYFPKTVEAIEAAQEMGSLFISMECIADTVTRVDKDGSETTFPFQGGSVKDYEFHGESDYVRLNDPHFVGCGLVLPPAKPGWKGAEVRELMSAVSDDGEALYEQVKSLTPQLSPQEWETLMLSFLASAKAR
jgi:hypothetical protein